MAKRLGAAGLGQTVQPSKGPDLPKAQSAGTMAALGQRGGAKGHWTFSCLPNLPSAGGTTSHPRDALLRAIWRAAPISDAAPGGFAGKCISKKRIAEAETVWPRTKPPIGAP